MIQLVHNSKTCLQCGEVLVSRHRHDFVRCDCENGTFCDGGLDYCRYGGKDASMIQDNCVYDNAPHEEIREVFERGTHGEDLKQKLHYVKLKDIDDKWLRNIIDYESLYRPDNPFLKIYKQEVKYRKKNGSNL